ncbi:unnamed protein product [Allacma fusca]|uniref:Uncharacterized protein n=1 Tax=Allacma fusca TaxID=39272 RepID=A0A8J2JJW2_9HEXA|nr:unnamed protein product [Allacma fusca]
MGRGRYKKYLEIPTLQVVRVPRQTKFNRKRRKCAVMEENQMPITPVGINQIVEVDVAPDYEAIKILMESEYSVSSSDELNEELVSNIYRNDDESAPDLLEENHNFANEMGTSCINANLTVQEGCFLVFAFILKHRLSNTAVQDLLDLLRFFVPGTDFPSSKYLLQKRLHIDYEVKQYIYYCSKCNTLLQEDSRLCSSCDFQNLDSGNCFVLFDLKTIFEDILKQKDVASNVWKNMQARAEKASEESTYFENIYDGKMYKRLTLGEHDLTATMNCDGVPCFKSSKMSIYPFLVSINELTYPLRRKHTLTAALWFGSEKPIFRTFCHTLFPSRH